MSTYVIDYQNLRLGDVVLTSERAIPSKAIRLATAGRYSHAALWVGGSLIEATLSGVFSANPQRMLFTNADDAVVLRSKEPLTQQQSKLICNYARSCVGSLYALSELALLPVGRFKRIGALATRRQFCSRLVAMAYEHAGIELSERIDSRYCTPRMISLSKKLAVVPGMMREALPEELEIAASPDGIKMNQEKFFMWLNGIRSMVQADPVLSLEHDIQSDGDAYELLLAHPELDAAATELLRKSGYLSFYNYDASIPRLSYRYDRDAMNEALESADSMSLLQTELEKEPELFKRYDAMCIVMSKHYRATGLQFFRELVLLYRNLLDQVRLRLEILSYGFSRVGDQRGADSVRQLSEIAAQAVVRANQACS